MASWHSGAWSSASPPFPSLVVPAVASRVSVRAGRRDGGHALPGFCGRGPSGIRGGGACIGGCPPLSSPLLRLGRADRTRAGVCRQRVAGSRSPPGWTRGGNRAGLPGRIPARTRATEEACCVPRPRACVAALGRARVRPARPGWSRRWGGRRVRRGGGSGRRRFRGCPARRGCGGLAGGRGGRRWRRRGWRLRLGWRGWAVVAGSPGRVGGGVRGVRGFGRDRWVSGPDRVGLAAARGRAAERTRNKE